MKKYSHLLFDLDKTIWDFAINSEDTLRELYDDFSLKRLGISDFMTFFRDYEKINLELWECYRQNGISKSDLIYMRFYKAFLLYGIDDLALSKDFSEKYLQVLPAKNKVFPGTYETLDYLGGRYTLHIVTNGFEEVQYRKIHYAGLEKYFDRVITSEKAGCKKPDRMFFEYTLKEINAAAKDCLMIGDDMEVDLAGSRRAGIDQVFCNFENIRHDESFTFEISQINDLRTFL
ncbi:MAG TPA: YjjG family noncanonical pyrimidine nucleotidase [Bacteroidales bacterium]|nr:YjjG family noncanonical pyrimidine nucleotidase [Bacteroidales bacterium]HQI70919.1 YjjG family noncanonical pyrimidine nucleotidase [Bacteroidales bacterium]